MPDACIPVEELAVLVDDAQDPRHEHLRVCPRCRALLASYGRFIAADPALQDREAEAELSQRLAAAISPRDTEREPGLIRRLWAGAWMRPALGGAAILAAFLLLMPPQGPEPSDPSGLLRQEGAIAADIGLEATALEAGGHRLVWQAFEGARAYRVRLFDAERSLLATLDAGTDTQILIDRPAAFWQVEIRRSESAPLFSKLEPLARR